MARSQDLSQKVQEEYGLPPKLKLLTPFPFTGMNQQAGRFAIADSDLFWLENYIPIGPGNYRAAPDIGPVLWSVGGETPRRICNFVDYNIGDDVYFAAFLNDGTAVQVDTAGNATDISAVAQTFYHAGGFYPAAVQWGALYLLIANNNTSNDYWAWDGSVLYTAGTIAPQITIDDAGFGYTSAPAVTAFGGSGSGIAITANVVNGSVVSLKVTNPGLSYQPGDQVQLAFSGGGSDTSAQLVATISGDQLQSIIISNGGGFYAAAPTITISGGGGSGAAAHAVLGASPTAGQVIAAVIDDPGVGYTGTPTVTFSAPGSGTTATGVARLNPGAVTGVTVVNGGTNFSGTPTLQIVGGGGSGAQATAVMLGGVIDSVTITNGGAGYTSTPAVIVQTGLNNAASATVSLMPYGVSGMSMETYQSQVWLQYPHRQPGGPPTGGERLSSATGSISDFATSDGGLDETNADRFLRQHYTAIRQSNGYLYPFGDSSANVIGNVQVSGVPPSKTLLNQNTDPQTGTHWRDTLADFSRTIIFANPIGVYGLFGGAIQKISTKIDNVITDAVLPVDANPSPTGEPLVPSSAVANVYSQKIYLCLMNLRDPFTGGYRHAMVAWNERDWFIISQSADLTFVTTREINSQLFAWGTDGISIFPLLTTPSSAITKTLSTKLWGAQDGLVIKLGRSIYVQAENKASNFEVPIFSFTVDTEYAVFEGPATPQVVFPPLGVTLPSDASQPIVGQAPMLAAPTGDVRGCEMGFTLRSTSADFVLLNTFLAVTADQGALPVA